MHSRDRCVACNHKSFYQVNYGQHLQTILPTIRGAKKIIKTALLGIFDLGAPVPGVLRRRVLVWRAFHNTFRNKNIKICSNCGLGIIYPMPSQSDLDRYYKHIYWQSREQGLRLSVIDARGQAQADYISTFIEIKQLRRILEFGAGQAGVSRALKQRNPSISIGIVEESELMRELHRKNGEVDDIALHLLSLTGRFDLIMASHSLEHVGDVEATLSLFVELLRPDGRLFVEVPNCYQRYFELDIGDAPHTYFFTGTALAHLVARYGMKVEDVSEWGPTWAEHGRGNLADGHLYFRSRGGWHLRGMFSKPR